MGLVEKYRDLLNQFPDSLFVTISKKELEELVVRIELCEDWAYKNAEGDNLRAILYPKKDKK